MNTNTITPDHFATITDADGNAEVVACYTIPSNLTAEEFGAYFDALMATSKAVA